MNTGIQAGGATASFGAKAAGIIFLLVLVSYILSDVLIAGVLSHAVSASSATASENQAAALRRALSGAVGPCLMFVITLALLKASFPKNSLKDLLGRFGLSTLPAKRVLIASFLGGVTLMLFYSRVLTTLFPPDEFAAAHPANVINHGTVLQKLLFVVSAVVMAPIAEEFLFRGVMYAGMAHSWNKVVAAILVSICFILIHPETLSSGYWLSHYLLYFIAFTLLLVREISGTLFTSILVHSGFNFAIVFL